MYCDWWDITVDGRLLVTINGKSTADFFYKYFSHDSSYHYVVHYSEKINEEEPVSPWDLAGEE